MSMIIHSRFRGIKISNWWLVTSTSIQGKHCLSTDGGILPWRTNIAKWADVERDRKQNFCQWVIMYNSTKSHSHFQPWLLDPHNLALGNYHHVSDVDSNHTLFFWVLIPTGFPRWLSGKQSTCQCKRYKRHGFSPWVRKISWRRKWQPTPVFLPA